MPQPIEQQKWEIEFDNKFGGSTGCDDKNCCFESLRKEIKEWIRSQRQSAREEVLLKAKGAIQELINISNENASNDWYDGLRASRSCVETLLKGLAPQE